MSNPLILAREDKQPPSEKEEELPSGQRDTTNIAGSSQDEEFESLGILTQYIGPAQPANSEFHNI